MALVINTNVASLQAQRNLGNSQNLLATSFNRLSSGYRINSAKDDAAGLAISESMKMQIRSYTVVERNANDAVSMSQTAEGALGQLSDILGRMRELAAQGSNGALQSSDRSYLQTEFKSLQDEVRRIMTTTKFNGAQMIASSGSPIVFQVGIQNLSTDRITITFGGVKLTSLLTGTTRVQSGQQNSWYTLDQVDTALQKVSQARARYGAVMNRIDITVANIQTARLNLASANSRIRDVDVAEEAAMMSRQQVLMQAGSSILAQANQSPQMALSLLK
ncbi:MAG: flagellin [Myxococcales bacterium]